jgi:hypothetical protein
MVRLYPSQIETLEAVAASDHERATPAMVGGHLACSARSARARLNFLAHHRYLYTQLGLRRGQYYPGEFGLTDKGRAALASTQKGRE